MIRFFPYLFVFLSAFSVAQTEWSNDSVRFVEAGFKEKNINLYFIPIDCKVDRNFFLKVNTSFSKAKIKISPFLLPAFNTEFEPVWDNPPKDSLRFSRQMRQLRDDYFKKLKERDPNGIFCFVIPEFRNDSIRGYGVNSKSIFFISKAIDSVFDARINFHIGFSLGLNSSKLPENVMNPNFYGSELSWPQCWDLRNAPNSFSLYDDYEFIRTGNGLFAYYFWEQDKDGWFEVDSLKPFKSILRPQKYNHLVYYLKVDNFFFKPLFKFQGQRICLVHVLTLLLSLILIFLGVRRINKSLTESGFFKRQGFRLLKLVFWSSAALLVYSSFYIVEFVYDQSIILDHKLNDFKGIEKGDLKKKVNNPELFVKRFEEKQGSYIFQRKNETWYYQQEKPVLYFEVRNLENKLQAKFQRSSNELEIGEEKIAVRSHYMVFRYFDENDSLLGEKVFNYRGIDLTEKRNLVNPAKRILLFVNGYRPVSLSNNFRENINDIQKKGLEFPNSKNYLYDYDRFGYWTPWNNINVLFQKRINPGEVWYADGHHSVSTSNHRSLVNFTTNSGIYPQPCKAPKGREVKHSCQKTTIAGGKEIETITLLATNPNEEGFNFRRGQGRIAGRNLLQQLNEMPNKSENDTLFVVAHSMGYAYALGMIDILRGKIQFGGFYIIAPENANSGKVLPGEWNEVWQYGAKLNGKNANAPCEQDGVAPQFLAKGLNETHRTYFPLNQRHRMGYFESHFIGYYTWIFDLIEKENGYILQR
jgi:hypothetical protein